MTCRHGGNATIARVQRSFGARLSNSRASFLTPGLAPGLAPGLVLVLAPAMDDMDEPTQSRLSSMPLFAQ